MKEVSLSPICVKYLICRVLMVNHNIKWKGGETPCSITVNRLAFIHVLCSDKDAFLGGLSKYCSDVRMKEARRAYSSYLALFKDIQLELHISDMMSGVEHIYNYLRGNTGCNIVLVCSNGVDAVSCRDCLKTVGFTLQNLAENNDSGESTFHTLTMGDGKDIGSGDFNTLVHVIKHMMYSSVFDLRNALTWLYDSSANDPLVSDFTETLIKLCEKEVDLDCMDMLE